MPRVLVCSAKSLAGELAGTFFVRADVEQREVSGFDEARAACSETDFSLVAVESRLPDAARLIRNLRHEPRSRHMSIVVLAGSDFDPGELELLEAGANGILRLPATADWDARLTRLCSVPVRREARFPLLFEISTLSGPGWTTQRAQTRNISVTGLLVDSTDDLTVGTDIRFRFDLPESVEVRGRGRVVRRAPRSQLFGIEFEDMEGDGVARIQAFVDSRSTVSQAL